MQDMGAARETQVMGALGRLSKTVDELADRLRTLKARITPVSRQEEPTINKGSGGPPTPTYTVPVASMIHEKTSQIIEITILVDDAIDRLEI